VVLHVGVAKTGTTFLQRILVSNRSALQAAGTVYPGDSPHSHFRAALDLRGGTFAGHEYQRAKGAWAAVTREVNAFDGPAVISHESLARTRRQDRIRAVKDFDSADVRIVITARDLGRQIPAVWQENVKNRNQTTYAEFLDHVFDERRRAKFWRAQDLVSVARRWAEQVGSDAVTIVTVPPPGGDRSELWTRFRRACGLPDLDYHLPEVSDNRSMGSAESEVLRRMNACFDVDLPWPRYEARVKRGFVIRVLSTERRHGPLRVPPRWHEATQAQAARQVAQLSAAGYPVVGDLNDLHPQVTDVAEPGPDEFSPEQLLDVSLHLLSEAALLDKSAVHTPESEPDPDGKVTRLARRLRRG